MELYPHFFFILLVNLNFKTLSSIETLSQQQSDLGHAIQGTKREVCYSTFGFVLVCDIQVFL